MTIDTKVKSNSFTAAFFSPLQLTHLFNPARRGCSCPGWSIRRLTTAQPSRQKSTKRWSSEWEQKRRLHGEILGIQVEAAICFWSVDLKCLSVCMALHRINDILLSGPLNISESKNTHNEFVVRWTPIQEDLGQHFPICFAVESVGWVSLAAGAETNTRVQEEACSTLANASGGATQPHLNTIGATGTSFRDHFVDKSITSVVHLRPWSCRCLSANCS